MSTYADALRHHVERSLRRDLALPPVEPDGDGDYGAMVGDMVVWTRPVLGDDPPLVRVWTPAARGVKKSAALLTEINDLNVGLDRVRCLLSNGTVIISAEVEIEALDEGQLGRLVTHVGETAHHVGHLIAAVYGGESAAITVDEDEPADIE